MFKNNSIYLEKRFLDLVTAIKYGVIISNIWFYGSFCMLAFASNSLYESYFIEYLSLVKSNLSLIIIAYLYCTIYVCLETHFILIPYLPQKIKPSKIKNIFKRLLIIKVLIEYLDLILKKVVIKICYKIKKKKSTFNVTRGASLIVFVIQTLFALFLLYFFLMSIQYSVINTSLVQTPLYFEHQINRIFKILGIMLILHLIFRKLCLLNLTHSFT